MGTNLKESTGDHKYLMKSWQKQREEARAYPERFSDADLAWLEIDRTTDYQPQLRDDFLKTVTTPADSHSTPKSVRLDDINPLVTGNTSREKRRE